MEMRLFQIIEGGGRQSLALAATYREAEEVLRDYLKFHSSNELAELAITKVEMLPMRPDAPIDDAPRMSFFPANDFFSTQRTPNQILEDLLERKLSPSDGKQRRIVRCGKYDAHLWKGIAFAANESPVTWEIPNPKIAL